MRVLLTSMVCWKEDPEANLAAHVEVLGQAKRAGCDLAVFPEYSLTGSVDPRTHPERAVSLDDPLVRRMVAATGEVGVPALFGIEERDGDHFSITQVYAYRGHIEGKQRKRHLGEGEEGHSTDRVTTGFWIGSVCFGVVICAESRVDFTWDAAASLGVDVVFFCSAPGLHGRRSDAASWQAGFDWWETSGLGDARAQAKRCGFWVAMATQAGATEDEDFPGLAAVVAPAGEVVDRLPDWHPGMLIADLPFDIDEPFSGLPEAFLDR